MTPKNSCSAPDCGKETLAHGYCLMHYTRMRRHGSLDKPAPTRKRRKRTNELDRFWSKVDRSSVEGCWFWVGPVNNKGYGRFAIYDLGATRRVLAHRYSLSLSEPLESGLVVMHRCDTPRCVNPAHLSQGTQGDNLRDALAKGRMNLDGLALGRAGLAAKSLQRLRRNQS